MDAYRNNKNICKLINLKYDINTYIYTYNYNINNVYSPYKCCFVFNYIIDYSIRN